VVVLSHLVPEDNPYRLTLKETTYSCRDLRALGRLLGAQPLSAEELLSIPLDLIVRLYDDREWRNGRDIPFYDHLRRSIREGELPHLFYEGELDGKFTVFLEYGGELPILSAGYDYVKNPLHRVIRAIVTRYDRLQNDPNLMKMFLPQVYRLPRVIVDRAGAARVTVLRQLLWRLLTPPESKYDALSGTSYQKYTLVSKRTGARIPIVANADHVGHLMPALAPGWDADVEAELYPEKEDDQHLFSVVKTLCDFDALFPGVGGPLQVYDYLSRTKWGHGERRFFSFRAIGRVGSPLGKRFMSHSQLMFAFAPRSEGDMAVMRHVRADKRR
jgi:hypothetical protein